MAKRFALNLLILIGAITAMIGCGGGGGSTPTAFSVIYDTDWTLFAQPGGGQSQRVTLLDSNGIAVDQIVMNQDVVGIQQHVFNSVPVGSIRLVVELFSGRNLEGTQTGVLERTMTLDRAVTLRSAVGKVATRLVITPASATLTVPQNLRFTATPFAADDMAFVATGTLTWSTTGSIGTINTTTGEFVSTAAGTGSVVATVSSPSLTLPAPVIVRNSTIRTSKWTILVYMNAANDLNSFSVANVNQMESIAQNSEVRIVLQWKQATGVSPDQTFNGTRRYLIKADVTDAIKSTLVQDLGEGIDMGKPETLKEFVTWAKTYYPSERTALVIWNHGNGWRRSVEDLLRTRAVSYDDETGNAIQIWQLPTAFSGQTFDIIAWDASLMQMLEVADEVGPYTQFIVGSEESPPGEGYPYDLILKEFRDAPNTDTATLAKAFVDGMLAVPAYQTRKITQSVIQSSKLNALNLAVDLLAVELIAHEIDIEGVIPTVRSQSKTYSPRGNPPRYYLDLYDLCGQMRTLVGETSVQDAASAVQLALRDAVVSEGHTSLSAHSNGISIDFSPATSFNPSAADYALMQFAIDTRWDDYLMIAP